MARGANPTSFACVVLVLASCGRRDFDGVQPGGDATGPGDAIGPASVDDHTVATYGDLGDDAPIAVITSLDGNVLMVIPTTRFDPAKCYDIIGLLGYFNGTPQLKPRIPPDVTEVAGP